MIAITDSERKLIESIIRSEITGCAALAFGSRVNGTHTASSDLDIAIIASDNHPVPIWDIKEQFMESDIPFKVDVLDYNQISDTFRRIIDQGCELIFDTRGAEIDETDYLLQSPANAERLMRSIYSVKQERRIKATSFWRRLRRWIGLL